MNNHLPISSATSPGQTVIYPTYSTPPRLPHFFRCYFLQIPRQRLYTDTYIRYTLLVNPLYHPISLLSHPVTGSMLLQVRGVRIIGEARVGENQSEPLNRSCV